MSIFTNKKIFQKVGIILLLVVFFWYISPNFSLADDGSWGGKLLTPIMDLLTTIGDGLLGIAHKALLQQDTIYITVDTASKFWDFLAKAAIFIAAAIAAAAVIILTAGAAAAILGSAVIVSLSAGTIVTAGIVGGVVAVSYYDATALPTDLKLPVYNLSPEEIFQGKIPALDVDFINPKTDQTMTYKDKDGKDQTITLTSTAAQLRSTISSWYIGLRTIALVALLSILAYIGIRMLLTSIASDKAKYKSMMIDWVVAICLVFFMHYIMAFALAINEKIIEMVSSYNSNNGYTVFIEDKDNKISKALEQLGYKDEDIHTATTGDKVIAWPTDLMGKSRIDLQMHRSDGFQFVGYVLIYLVLVIFTAIFLFTYIKRVIYMAFLTIIAPLVAMTYPIDKINDGKAQAFDLWFKEYIFNLLIQPMHLIIYTVLVTSAFSMASTNVLYSLVALGFMVPAEQLIRKFFGFEKAGTAKAIGGAAGAALAMKGIQQVMGMSHKGGGSSGKGGNDSKADEANALNIRRRGFDPMAAMAGNKDSNPKLNGGKDASSGASDKSDSELLNNGEEAELAAGVAGGVAGASMADGLDNNKLKDRDNPYNDGDIRSNTEIMASAEENQRLADNAKNEEEKKKYEEAGQRDKERLNQRLMKQDEDRLNQERKNIPNNPEKIRMAQQQAKEQPKLDKDSPRKKAIAKALTRMARSRGGRIAGATFKTMGGAFGGYAKLTGKRIQNSHPLKFAAKTAVGAAGAVAFGTAAAAAGVVSGDIGTAAKYTAAGVTGGAAFGEGLYNTVDSMGPQNVMGSFKENFYGDQYKDHLVKEYTDRYTRDEKNIGYLTDTFGNKKKAKEIMKNTAPKCIDNGITDIKDIAAIQRMVDDSKGSVDIDGAMSAAKYSKRIGKSTDSLKGNDKEQYIKKWQEEYTKAGYKDEKLGSKTYDMVEKFNSAQSSLNKF